MIFELHTLVESLAQGYNRLGFQSNFLVKPDRCIIITAHHQLDFRSTALPQPVFGNLHQLAPDALFLEIRGNRQIIDPAAMAIETHHHASDQHLFFTR